MKTIAKDELEIWKLRLREAIENKNNKKHSVHMKQHFLSEISECRKHIKKCLHPKCSECYWCVHTFNFTPMCRNMDSENYNKINSEPCEKYIIK